MHLDSSPSATAAPHTECPTGSDWVDVCSVSELMPGVGAAVFVNGEQVALFRDASGDHVYAISNYDPFSRAFVLSRGIVGDRGGVPKVASPMYKQSFDLRTGRCLEDASVSVPAFEARVSHGRVLLRAGVTA